MDPNRRRHFRKIPEDFTFIQIERDEIGMVLNVSEGGLSFSSLAPVPEYGPLYFWLSFDLKDRIEAMGDLAWTDASRKIGGLRFTQLSQNGREQIRWWLSQLRPEVDAEKEPVLQVVPLSLSLEGNESSEISPSPLPSRGVDSAELVPLRRYLSVKKRQFILGVLLGVCVSAAVTVSALEYWRHHSEAAPAKTTATKSSLQENDARGKPTASQLEATPRSPILGISSTGARNNETTSKRSATRPLADSYVVSPPYTTEFKALKPSTPIGNPSQLAGKPSQGKKPMTPAQLWVAVQAGNTKAAVQLAELYIKGDGVPQNCRQARVLLLVASQKRDAAAIERLQQLDKNNTCL